MHVLIVIGIVILVGTILITGWPDKKNDETGQKSIKDEKKVVEDVKQETLVDYVNRLDDIKSSDLSEINLDDFKLCANCKRINLNNFTKCHVCGGGGFVSVPSFSFFSLVYWQTGIAALFLVVLKGIIGIVGFIVIWICVVLMTYDKTYDKLKKAHEKKIRPLKEEAALLLYKVKRDTSSRSI